MSNKSFFTAQKIRSSDAVFYSIVLLIIVAVLPPISFLLIFSLSDAEIGEMPREVTLQHYIKIFTTARDLAAIINSLIISLISASAGAILALIMAWVVVRTNTPLVRELEPLLILPASISPFLYALSWTSILDPYVGIINVIAGHTIFNIYSLGGIILVLTFASMPLSYIVIKPFYESLDSTLEEASIISGVGKWKTTLYITHRLAIPSLLGAFILAFVWNMEELGVPLILASRSDIPMISLRIYELTLTFPPDINRASTLAIITMILSTTLYYMTSRFMGGRRWAVIGARGYRRNITDLGWLKYLTTLLVLLYISIASLLPLIGVILQALYPGYSIPGSIHQLTFKNFQDLLAIPLAVDAIKNSLIISTIGSFLLVFLAFFISYIVHRTEFKFRRFLDVISMLPVSIPSIVIALGIFLYFVYIMPVFLYISIWSIMLGLMIRFIGHSVRAVSAGLSQVHQILEEAARVHGVPRHIIVYDIYIKILVPTFISTYTFIFIYFVRELPLSILLATSKNMVWTAGIYTLLELGNLKLVMAFALLEILLILSVRYVGNYLTKFVARWYI